MPLSGHITFRPSSSFTPRSWPEINLLVFCETFLRFILQREVVASLVKDEGMSFPRQNRVISLFRPSSFVFPSPSLNVVARTLVSQRGLRSFPGSPVFFIGLCLRRELSPRNEAAVLFSVDPLFFCFDSQRVFLPSLFMPSREPRSFPTARRVFPRHAQAPSDRFFWLFSGLEAPLWAQKKSEAAVSCSFLLLSAVGFLVSCSLGR